MVRLVLLLTFTAAAGAQSFEELALPMPAPRGKTVAIGFLGGMDRWNNPERGVRGTALRLREQGLVAETFANRKLGLAKKALLKALDCNADGRVDATEAAEARVILYGQSLGGNATVRMARFLNSRHIPVLLTVQVDSFGLGDKIVPPNVKAAVNFYQKERFTIRGEAEIRAADSTKTHILGNYEYEYPIWMPSAWQSWRTVIGGGHARMEADPILWSRVEGMILAAAQSKTR
jgi:hypothetical protein